MCKIIYHNIQAIMPRPFSQAAAVQAMPCYAMNSIHITSSSDTVQGSVILPHYRTLLLYLYPIVTPTLEYASAVCDLYTTTQTDSLIILIIKILFAQLFAMPRPTHLVIHHHGFLVRLPPDGITSFKSRGGSLRNYTIARGCLLGSKTHLPG